MRLSVKDHIELLRSERRQAERLRAITAAVTREMNAFNAALAAGKTAVLHTALGDYPVTRVRPDFWVECGTGLHQRSFAICNDSRWASLLQQAGVPRDPLFQEG
jgi:hypothetical protein